MKRTLSLVLILSLLFSLMLCIIPTAEDEAVAVPSPDITHANVVFGNSVHLLIAVSYTGVYADAETAAENIYITVDGERINSYGAAPSAIGGIAFKYTSIAAKEMGDELVIKAYDNGVEVDSTAYSILEYAIKAKSTDASNTLLVTAIDAMMAYGKAAQEAFSYAGDYDLSKFDQYGLIAVGGAKQSKYIALADSVVTPEAIDASVPYLYDMEFDKVAGNSVTVKAGYNRYFFYDDAAYGHENVYGYDMDIASHDTSALFLQQPAAGSGYIYMRTIVNSGVPQIRIKNWSGSAFPLSMGATTSTESILQIQEDYWAAKTMGDAEGHSGTAAIMASTTLVANKYLDEDGIFTVCLSLAKIADTPIANGPSFRISNGKSGVTANCFWRFFANGTDAGTSVLTQSKGAPLVTLKEVSDADFKAGNVDKEDFTTFYLVFDTKAMKVTAYTADGNTVKANTAPIPTPAQGAFSSLYDYLMDSNCYFDWTMSANGGGLIVNKMIMTPGNIFN